MNDWHSDCIHGCRDGSHGSVDIREGHGSADGIDVSMGYTCRCGAFRQELDEWHDHLVGNENDRDQAERRKTLEEIIEEIVTRYEETLRKLGES